MKLNFYFLIEICLFLIQLKYINTATDSNENLLIYPYNFRDEICSYNGEAFEKFYLDTNNYENSFSVKATSTAKFIYCKCNDDYATLTDLVNVQPSLDTILIQCNYQKK